jgi:prepilin-type N-terminal cleavage/methylation domain-containing protein
MLKPVINKKGVTMMELIVSILVFTIIMAAATSIFAPMLRGFQRANNLAEANTIMDNIATFILDDIRRADTPRPQEPIYYFTLRENAPPAPSPPPTTDPVSGNARLHIIYNPLPVSNIVYEAIDGRIWRAHRGNEAIPLFDDGFYRGTEVTFSWEWFRSGPKNGLVELTLSISHPDGWQRDRVYTARPLGLTP